MLVVLSSTLYFVVALSSLNISNILLMFMLLEALSWIFSYFLGQQMLKYLLIQSVFFLGGLFGVLVFKSLVFIFFLLKLGLPPLYIWVVSIMVNANKTIFFFFFSVHKLLPLMFLKVILISMKAIYLILVLSLILIFQVSSIFFILTLSSFVQSVWMLVSILLSSGLFLMYWVYYSSVIFLFLNSLGFYSLSLLSMTQGLLSGFIWLVLMGLPPFLMFWLKFSVLAILINKMSVLLSVFLLISSVLSIMMYYRSFNSSLGVNKKKDDWVMMTLPFFILFF